VHPTSEWNYAIEVDPGDPGKSIRVEEHAISDTPFATGEAPVTAKVKGKKVKGWDIEKNAAAAPPKAPVETEGQEKELTLVPYGCARLRVSEMPVIG